MQLKSLKYILATIIFFLSFNLAFSTDLIIPKIKPSKQKDALLKNLSSNIIIPKQNVVTLFCPPVNVCGCSNGCFHQAETTNHKEHRLE